MEPQTRLLEYRPKRPPSGQRLAVLHEAAESGQRLAVLHEAAESGRPARRRLTAALMEAMRTTRLPHFGQTIGTGRKRAPSQDFEINRQGPIGSAQNDGIALDRGQSARDVEDDTLPP